MGKRRVLINAAMSVAQVLVVGITLFLLYRFLLRRIGVESLGIWSLTLATTSAAQITNIGLSGSVVKFVAKYTGRKEPRQVSEVIQTAAISLALSLGLVLTACYPLLRWILGLIVPANLLGAAISILPFAMLSLWLLGIASVFLAGLDGLQRIYLRSLLLMAAAIGNLLLCILLVPAHGLMGLAIANSLQSGAIAVASWLLLKGHFPGLPAFPRRWNWGLFKEMAGYGINFQVMSVFSILLDPVTKSMLSVFGGLAMVGYYEMANRMVLQLRSLLVSANQVLVPVIADLKERDPLKIQGLYLTSYQLLFFLAVPLYTAVIIMAPLVSRVWIGAYEPQFVYFAAILAVGYFLNSLSAPAAMAFLGIGELRWVVISYAFVAGANVLLSWLLGSLFGGYGVITGWMISLGLGSIMALSAYQWKYHLGFREALPRASRPLFYLCATYALMDIAFIRAGSVADDSSMLTYLITMTFVVTLSFFLWLHPMRKQTLGWIAAARNDSL